MGAQARLEIRHRREDDFQTRKQAGEKRKSTAIAAETFDQQVRGKLGELFEGVFRPWISS